MPTDRAVILIGMQGNLLEPVILLIETVAKVAGQPAPLLLHYDATVPDVEMIGAIERGDICAFAVIDHPLACLSALVETGQAPIDAARALTATAAAVIGLTGPVVRLQPDMTVGQASDAIRAGLQFPCRPGGSAGGWPADTRLSELANATRPCLPQYAVEIATLSRDVVAPLFGAAATGTQQTVTWPRCSLFWGDHPGQRLPRILDLTGPARVLAYGPYFHLPRGGWTVQATLAFAPGATGAPFAVELHSNTLLGRGRFMPDKAGIFPVSFPVEIGSPYLPNEVRIVSERGAIDGKIGVDHVLLIPHLD